MNPTVPFHRLPTLYGVIEHDCAPSYPSTIAAWREMIHGADPSEEGPDVVRGPSPSRARAAVGAVMSGDPRWVALADAEDLEPEDVIEVTVEGAAIAVYRTKEGYFASDGICTHEHSRLCEGFVFGNIIECGKHQGRFDVRTGAPKRAPVHLPLKTYPVRVVDEAIEIDVSTLDDGAT